MKKESKLVHGKIPAGTICPFRGECELAKADSCGHLSEAHTIAYSCGAARAYDLFSDKKQITRQGHFGDRMIDNNGVVHVVNEINDRLGDEIIVFTVDGDEMSRVYHKPTGLFFDANSFFTFGDRSPNNWSFFNLQIDTEYLDEDGEVVKIDRIVDEDHCWTENQERRFTIKGFEETSVFGGYAKHIVGLNNDYVRGVLIERKHKPQDFVDVRAHDLESIPEGSNPFHYDLGNMGTKLVNGWIVMHAGPPPKDLNSPTTYLILVNTNSGQRIRLDLSKRK